MRPGKYLRLRPLPENIFEDETNTFTGPGGRADTDESESEKIMKLLDGDHSEDMHWMKSWICAYTEEKKCISSCILDRIHTDMHWIQEHICACIPNKNTV